MRKIYITLLSCFFICASLSSFSQVNGYVFSAGTTGTLEDMSSGATQLVGSSSDDGVSSVTPIGFSFAFNAVPYTQFSVNANGLIRLGATAVSGQWNNVNATDGFATAGNNPKIAPYFDDLATGTNGRVHYKLVGTAPNQKLVIEWIVTVPRATGGAANATFQAWLEEGTNRITFVYGNGMLVNTANGGYSIGIAGSATDFHSVTAASNTSSISTHNGTQTTAIASGTTYSFLPPPPCVSGSLAGGTTQSSVASACANAPFTLSVTGGSFGTGLTYQWQSSLTGTAGSFTDVATQTGQTYTVAAQTVPTYYRRKMTCSGVDAYSSELLVGQNLPTSCYCPISFPSNVEPITLVNFSNINNATSNTINGTPALEDFTSIVGNVNKGQSYLLRVKGNTDGGFTTIVTAYFDWNQDGDFLDALETVTVGNIVGSTGLDAIEASVNILIPAAALDGTTRMRVTKKFNTAATSCNNTGFGQAEDYTLSIVTPPCVAPSGLNVTAIAPTTATLAWTASASNPANGYEWEVRTSGAGGSGATGLVASGTTAAGVVTANATGLTANTNYSYYVRSNCGGIFSDWAGGFAFLTPCDPIAVPFLQDFSTYASTFPPTCWTRNNSVGLLGSAPSANGIGAGSAMFDFYNTSAGTNLDLVSPLFTPVPANHRLTFEHAYATFFGENDQLQISYSTDGGATYTTLITYNGGTNGPLNTGGSSLPLFIPGASNWAEKAIDLPVGTNRLRFRGISAFGNNLYLDNIIVEPTPSCLPPTGLVTANGISPTEAMVYFNSPGNAFIVEYGAPGFTPGTTNVAGTGGTIVLGTASPITVTGLTASTTYDFYVRRICIPGVDFSSNKKATATTLCPATNIPYLQNFETSVPLVGFPTCTSMEDVNGNSGPTPNSGGGRWITNSVAQTYNSPTRSLWYIYDLGNPARGGDDWFYLQGLNLTAGTTYRVKAYYKGSDAPNWVENFEVKYGTKAHSSAMTNLIYTSPTTSTTAASPFDSLIADFTPSATGVYYIGFHNISAPDQAFLFIDDISVRIAPKVDVGITGITLPSLNCPTSGVFVQATIRNYNTVVQDFATYPVTVNANITGAATGTLTTTLNQGTLAPGASMQVYLNPAFNFTTAGVYNITTTTVSPDDPETGNDAFVTSVNVNPNPATPVITPALSQLCLGQQVQLNTQFTNPPPAPVTLAPVTSGAITVAIPDGSAVGVTHSLQVTGVPAGATVTGISVTVNLTHTWVSDMVVNLRAPNSKILNLFNAKGGSGDNMTNMVISSASTTPIGTPPFTGTWAADAAVGVGPNGNQSNVNKFDSLYSVGNGTWTLALQDLVALDPGTLTSWSITLTYQMRNPVVTWTPVAGLFTNVGATNAYTAGTDAFSVYAKPAALGTYTYVATATNSAGCTSTGSAVVTVNGSTPLTIGNNPDTVCISDQMVDLLATPSNGNWTGVGVSGNTFIPPSTAVGTYNLTYSYTNEFGCASTATDRIAVKDCPERIILLRDDAVTLFPNPNNGKFNIRINSVLYNNLGMKVYTNSGTLVRTQQFGGLVYGRVVPIDLTNLPGGVYMVHFYYEGGVRSSGKTFKVIIGLP